MGFDVIKRYSLRIGEITLICRFQIYCMVDGPRKSIILAVDDSKQDIDSVLSTQRYDLPPFQKELVPVARFEEIAPQPCAADWRGAAGVLDSRGLIRGGFVSSQKTSK